MHPFKYRWSEINNYSCIKNKGEFYTPACSYQVANFYCHKFPGSRFCREFFISRRSSRADGAADDLHYILNEEYVIRRADGSATKTIVRDRAQLLTLLSDRFGLRAADLDLPELTKYLGKTDAREKSQHDAPAVAPTATASAAAKADVTAANSAHE